MSRGPKRLTLINTSWLGIKFLIKEGRVMICARIGDDFDELILSDRLVRRLHNWLGWYLAKK